jgi:hypothetical protein
MKKESIHYQDAFALNYLLVRASFGSIFQLYFTVSLTHGFFNT